MSLADIYGTGVNWSLLYFCFKKCFILQWKWAVVPWVPELRARHWSAPAAKHTGSWLRHRQMTGSWWRHRQLTGSWWRHPYLEGVDCPADPLRSTEETELFFLLGHKCLSCWRNLASLILKKIQMILVINMHKFSRFSMNSVSAIKILIASIGGVCIEQWTPHFSVLWLM